jgi:membrane protein required for colicin V production
MTTIDIILILPLALAIISGYRKGLIIEIAALVAFIIGIIACLKLTHKVILFVHPWTGDSKWVPLICYLVVFLAVYLLVMWIGKLLEKVVKIVQLGLINRLLGVLFSLLKMCFFISLVLWLINQVHLIPDDVKDHSVVYKALNHFASDTLTFLSNYLPYVKGEISEIEQFFDKLGK